jgi:hypothetical protein
MGDIVTRSQRRANMDKASPVLVPEWKSLISEVYGELYSIVSKSGWRYFESTFPITATGAASYPLPNDHDLTIGADRVLADGTTTPLGEVGVFERNAFAGRTGDAVTFSVVGQTIVLGPRPSSGAYQFLYVPQAPDISTLADNSTVDVVTADGEAFLIWGVAAAALPRTESSRVDAVEDRNAARERLAQDCTMRSLANPRRRIVVQHPLDDYGIVDDPLDYDPASWRWRR